MSDAPKPNSQGLDSEENETVTGGHPSYQEILDILPPEFHSLVTPKLEYMDKNLQKKLQEFEPVKKVIGDYTPEALQQAIYIADMLEKNPNEIVKQAIEHFGLDYVEKALEEKEVQSNDDNNDDDDFDLDSLGGDITTHPAFKQVLEQVQKLQDSLTSKETKEQEEQQEKEWLATLDKLKAANEDKGDFDTLYVTALVNAGLEPEKAVDQYYETIANALAARGTEEKKPDPVIMGASGTTGSGLPDNSVKMGDLSTSETNALVMKMIEASRNQT